jgi:Tol biopolymer transport system component
MADESGSRVVLDDAPGAQIANADYPALSPDGLSLTYIRETKGRGSLWLANVGPTSGTSTEVVGPPYDVRDAAFAPSGAVIFTARINGSTNIYQITPGGPLAVLVDDKEEVESANASPDGQRLVFRKLLHDRWQLMVMDLDNKQQHQLTFGDCHAYAPAWMGDSTIIYSTDCERGLGLTALASINVGR